MGFQAGEGLAANARNLEQGFRTRKRTVCLPRRHDTAGQHRPDAGQQGKLLGACEVDVQGLVVKGCIGRGRNASLQAAGWYNLRLKEIVSDILSGEQIDPKYE